MIHNRLFDIHSIIRLFVPHGYNNNYLLPSMLFICFFLFSLFDLDFSILTVVKEIVIFEFVKLNIRLVIEQNMEKIHHKLFDV